MSWKPLTQLPQATSPAPVSPPSPFSHHLLGLLPIACSGTHFPFQLNSLPLCPRPINARWLSLNHHSNQGLMRLISQNLGWFVFSNKPSFLGFSFASRSLATLNLRRWSSGIGNFVSICLIAEANAQYQSPNLHQQSHDLGSHDLLVHLFSHITWVLITCHMGHVTRAPNDYLIP